MRALVVISADIREIPPSGIRGLKVLRTVVGGRTVYMAPAGP